MESEHFIRKNIFFLFSFSEKQKSKVLASAAPLSPLELLRYMGLHVHMLLLSVWRQYTMLSRILGLSPIMCLSPKHVPLTFGFST